jgi:hypothetical protein
MTYVEIGVAIIADAPCPHPRRCAIFSATTLQYRVGTLACAFLSRRPAPERAVELIEQQAGLNYYWRDHIR